MWKAAYASMPGRFNAQWSAYDMKLKDEIHFSPATFTNTNLDPTRRYGVETSASYQLTDNLQIKGGVAYTRAVFRQGIFAGNDVPLVSRWTGNVGAILEYLAEISHVRRRGALRRPAADGQ